MSDQLFVELPLSAEEAYWHACTGTPVEKRPVVPFNVVFEGPFGICVEKGVYARYIKPMIESEMRALKQELLKKAGR